MPAQQRAAILTQKVLSIRNDYVQMQQMVKEHSGILLNEKLDKQKLLDGLSSMQLDQDKL